MEVTSWNLIQPHLEAMPINSCMSLLMDPLFVPQLMDQLGPALIQTELPQPTQGPHVQHLRPSLPYNSQTMVIFTEQVTPPPPGALEKVLNYESLC